MQLSNNHSNRYLYLLRYQKGYNPFSYNFDTEKNDALLIEATKNNAASNIIHLIKAGQLFHQSFHIPLVKELSLLLTNIAIPTQDIAELFIARINYQQLIIKQQKDSVILRKETFSASDVQNASVINNEYPDSINNLVQMSEDLIEFGNLVLNFLASTKLELNQLSEPDNTEENVFTVLSQIFATVNKYYLCKSFYTGCLSFNGDIFIGTNEIYFDSGADELYKIRDISTTIIENQRFNRADYFRHFSDHPYFKKLIPDKTNIRALKTATYVDGYINYTLRDRNSDDYKIYLDYLVTIHDYYSFFTEVPLDQLQGLTISKIMELHSELKNLVTEIYFNPITPHAHDESIKEFKQAFLPKISHADLRSYLLSVSDCSQAQVESFIRLLTFVKKGRSNLYETPLIKNKEYYHFPYLSIIGANYLFLIDYWLEQAGVSLDQRGASLEKLLKEKLLSIPPNGYNNYCLIHQKKFDSGEGFEEIDLLIETKYTFIIGEVKCIKYPMYDRDYPSILTQSIEAAEKQLHRKLKFLIDHQEQFSSVYNIADKKIIQVIILNIPVLTGASINGIPIIDYNLFTSYFQSNRIVKREMGVSDSLEIGEIVSYQSEYEFCHNLETFLHNNPLVSHISSQVKIEKSSMQMEGLPVFSFNNIYPVDPDSTIQNSV